MRGLLCIVLVPARFLNADRSHASYTDTWPDVVSVPQAPVIKSPPTLSDAKDPSIAKGAAAVGAPAGPQNHAPADSVQKVLNKPRLLQFASVDDNGRALAPSATGTVCISVGPYDRIPAAADDGQPFGTGVVSTPCPSSVQDAKPEDLWYFEEDGTVRAMKNGMCLRRRTCEYQKVFDLALCNEDSIVFRLRKSNVGDAEKTILVGLPVQGVVDGIHLAGPFQLYAKCKGIETEAGCRLKVPVSGWSAWPSNYLPAASYSVSDENGLLASVDDVLEEPQGMGVADKLLCGTKLVEAGRAENWWYFFSE